MRPTRIALLLILASAALLRFTGLDWSVDPETGRFHRFHPDEGTILDNTVLLAEDISGVKSAYGLIPVYLVYATGHVSGWLLDFTPFDFDDERSYRLSFLTARAISASLGTLTVLLAYLIGCRARGMRVGLGAAFLLSFSPGHIQQSHFYTVDVSLAFWVTLTLYLILLTPSSLRWRYLALGLAWGTAGGYRLLAGLLVAPFLIAHLWLPGDRSLSDVMDQAKPRLRSLISINISLSVALACGVVILAYPTLVTDPAALFSMTDQRDFAASVSVATGKLLRVWNLYDLTTTPYWFYITDLFPQSLGTLGAVTALSGIAALIYRPNRALSLLAVWIVIYFALTGGLFTKPTRYTTPMLSMLTCLAAYGWVRWTQLAERYYRPVAIGTAILVAVPTLAHGWAVASVYRQGNIRFDAVRWIDANIPPATPVIGETGGYPTYWMLGDRPKKRDPGSLFFRTQNHVLPSNIIDILHETVGFVDYIILIRQNRMIPYLAGRAEFPTAAEFYGGMTDGSLGYERVARFHRPAAAFGITFDRVDTDPTIQAFDRPTIEIYRRSAQFESLWKAWRDRTIASESNPDRMILEGVRQYQVGDYARSLATFEQAIRTYPNSRLPRLCRVESIYRMGSAQESQDSFKALEISNWDFVGLTLCGIPERGADYIRLSLLEKPLTAENKYIRQVASRAFIQLGDAVYESDRARSKVWYEKAVQMSQHFVRPYRLLGAIYLNEGEHQKALEAYHKAINLNRDIHELWVGLAVAASRLGHPQEGYRAAAEAIRIAPNESRYRRVLLNLADYFAEVGNDSGASDLRGWAGGTAPPP